MSSYKLVVFVITLFSATAVMGQQNDGPPAQRPVVTKGYYSIGKNAQKLAPATPLATRPVVRSGAEHNKGYYAIGRNRAKLAGEAAFIPLSGKRPAVNKGYYSIGNNAEKLKN